jgi:hemolysin activation/secretion protein
VFDGATLVPLERLRAATAPHAGPARDFGDVQRALVAVERAYAQAGWHAVQVQLPEQELERGEIHFRIREARLGRVSVEGLRHVDEANVRASLPALVSGVAPSIPEIGRGLRLANESPAKRTAVLLSSDPEQARVDAVVRVIDEPPVRRSVTVDATGTPDTGRPRLGLGYRHANVAGRDQVLRLHAVGGEGARIVAASLRVPLYGLGDALELVAGDANVAAGRAGELLEVTGAGTFYGLRYVRNLRAGSGYEDQLVIAWDDRAYDATPAATVRPLSLAYQGRMRRRDGDSRLRAGVWRNASSPEYVLWRWSFDHDQALNGGWRLRLGASGQATRDRLVPGERFGLGGAESVRGFEERALTGDRGYRGTLELQTPDFGATALAFFDWGALRRAQPAPGASVAPGVSSAGLGLRVRRNERLSLRLDWAWVLDPGAARERGDSRVHASLSFAF